MPDGQCSQRAAIDLQRLFATLGQGVGERHLVALIVTKQKGATTFHTLLGAGEDVVDRLDHRVTGAIVGVQRVPTPVGGLAGTQVSVDIGATKGIDRLLGIADQKESGLLVVVFEAVNAFEDPVLHRVGVLEFIDQCDRKLFSNQGGQSLAARTAQCGVKPEQHVIKAHFGTTALFFFKTGADPLRSMLQHGGIRCGQAVERGLEFGHGLERRVRGRIAFPGLGNTLRRQTCEARAEVQRFLAFVCGPCGQLFKPGFEEAFLHLATVDHLARHGVLTEGVQFVSPCSPRGFKGRECCPTLLQRRLDQLGRLLANSATVPAKQASHARQQRRRTAPVFPYPGQRVAAHGVAEPAPIIAQHLAEQVAVIGFEGLSEQAAAVESMLAQHALTPAVDGRYGRFVHPLRGDVQAAGTGWPLLDLELLAQLGDEAIRRCYLVPKKPRSVGQSRTNPVAQLLGRSVGKGHYEYLRRQQFTAEAGLF
ncbi:hypothetical protein ALP55_200018 [Pseudomonas coronafaciens pv. oryzae]|nr:hypothetical protein ALP55_200018 [Pseudomonas coronafaciens pv. oryzae]